MLRNQYAATRVLTRMKQRGELMTLRRVTLRDGPEGFKNPPDVSLDLVVFAANQVTGQDYFNLLATSTLGRLIPGDRLVFIGPPQTTWEVVTMPADVSTDDDGIPQVDIAGAPEFGTTPVYVPDSLGWNGSFPVVPVTFVHGPVMTGISLVLNRIAGTLHLAGGGFILAGLQQDDVIQISGAVAPNALINGVDLTVTDFADDEITVSGLPLAVVNGTLSNIVLTVTGGPESDVGNTLLTDSQAVDLVFAADAPVYGTPLSYSQMTTLGWIETDGLGLSIAAKGVDPPPKINDLLLLTSSGGEKRDIVQLSRRFSNGVQFLYQVQAR